MFNSMHNPQTPQGEPACPPTGPKLGNRKQRRAHLQSGAKPLMLPAEPSTSSARPLMATAQPFTPTAQPFTPSSKPFTPSAKPFTPSAKPLNPNTAAFTPSTPSFPGFAPAAQRNGSVGYFNLIPTPPPAQTPTYGPSPYTVGTTQPFPMPLVLRSSTTTSIPSAGTPTTSTSISASTSASTPASAPPVDMCQAFAHYHTCGCRAMQPTFICGRPSCAHERPTQVSVGMLPFPCTARWTGNPRPGGAGRGPACRGPDPGETGYQREEATGMKFGKAGLLVLRGDGVALDDLVVPALPDGVAFDAWAEGMRKKCEGRKMSVVFGGAEEDVEVEKKGAEQEKREELSLPLPSEKKVTMTDMATQTDDLPEEKVPSVEVGTQTEKPPRVEIKGTQTDELPRIEVKSVATQSIEPPKGRKPEMTSQGTQWIETKAPQQEIATQTEPRGVLKETKVAKRVHFEDDSDSEYDSDSYDGVKIDILLDIDFQFIYTESDDEADDEEWERKRKQKSTPGVPAPAPITAAEEAFQSKSILGKAFELIRLL